MNRETLTACTSVFLFLLAFLLLASVVQPPAALAQTREISGAVTDAETGNPLPGANVVVLGTAVGTATDANGTYRLEAPASADSLQFSFIGYEPQTVAIGGRTEINVRLTPAALEAGELVVTALGVEREERSLGYAAETVDGAELAEVGRLNVANALSGRVAGLKVSQAGSGPGGAARVVLRGSNSLSGDNQALIVLDGIPIDNSVLQPAGRFGGFDYGGGISELATFRPAALPPSPC